MISVIAHWVFVLIIYISQSRWQRSIAQQCANRNWAFQNHLSTKIYFNLKAVPWGTESRTGAFGDPSVCLVLLLGWFLSLTKSSPFSLTEAFQVLTTLTWWLLPLEGSQLRSHSWGELPWPMTKWNFNQKEGSILKGNCFNSNLFGSFCCKNIVYYHY